MRALSYTASTVLPFLLLSTGFAQTCEAPLLPFDADGDEETGTAVLHAGGFALAGAPGEDGPAGERDTGAAYVWLQSPLSSEWIPTGKLQPPSLDADDQFGASMARELTTVVIGAPGRPGVTATTEGKVFVYSTLDGLNWNLVTTLTASDGAVGDRFGADVDVSGDTIIVGAPDEDAAGSDRGAAYVYRRFSGIWIQSEKLMPPASLSGLGFGSTVELDGNIAVIGGPSLTGNVTTSGALAAYNQNSSGQMDLLHVVEPTDAQVADFFGASADLVGDMLLVGAPFEDDGALNGGAAYLFEYDSGLRRFIQREKLFPFGLASGDHAGASVAYTPNRIAIGADDRAGGGAVWTFTSVAGSWAEDRLVRPVGASGFGRAGHAIDLVGDTLLMSDPVDSTKAFQAGVVYALDVDGVDADGDGVTDSCASIFTVNCAPAAANSTGAGATMTASGSPFLSDQNLTIHVEDLPLHSFTLLVASMDTATVPNPGGSQGTLCLGGTIGRFNDRITSSEGDGAVSIPVDLDDLPNPLPVSAQVGETWHFQLWYRDVNPSQTSNFSGSVSVTLH